MIDAGRLRHRLRLEQYDYVLDSAGDVVQNPNTGEVAREWQLVAEVWGAIEPLSAREFIAAQSTQSRVSARITIRYKAGLNAAMRIVHGSTVYNIEGILPDKDSGLEYITMPVSEGVNEVGQ